MIIFMLACCRLGVSGISVYSYFKPRERIMPKFNQEERRRHIAMRRVISHPDESSKDTKQWMVDARHVRTIDNAEGPVNDARLLIMTEPHIVAATLNKSPSGMLKVARQVIGYLPLRHRATVMPQLDANMKAINSAIQNELGRNKLWGKGDPKLDVKPKVKTVVKTPVEVLVPPERQLNVAPTADTVEPASATPGSHGVPEEVVARYQAEIDAKHPPITSRDRRQNEELLEEWLEGYRIRHRD